MQTIISFPSTVAIVDANNNFLPLALFLRHVMAVCLAGWVDGWLDAGRRRGDGVAVKPWETLPNTTRPLDWIDVSESTTTSQSQRLRKTW